MNEEKGRLKAEAQKKMDEVKHSEEKMWSSHPHTEVQVREWQAVQ